MPDPESNFDICLRFLKAGDMPPVIAWQKAGEAARQYFILMALMRMITKFVPPLEAEPTVKSPKRGPGRPRKTKRGGVISNVKEL
jgi:hypothetical protein